MGRFLVFALCGIQDSVYSVYDDLDLSFTRTCECGTRTYSS